MAIGTICSPARIPNSPTSATSGGAGDRKRTWRLHALYEPRGDSDVMDVLEVANAQLLEMRYYDELLDDELPRMYDLVAKARRRRTLLASRRFADLARRLHTLVAEVTELTERVDNALQVTEDVYHARIYAAALELFRVPAVNAGLDKFTWLPAARYRQGFLSSVRHRAVGLVLRTKVRGYGACNRQRRRGTIILLFWLTIRRQYA